MPSRSAIAAAAERLSPHVRRTPMMALTPGEMAQAVWLKLEQLQHTGSFKARGAFNRLLAGPVPGAGVAAASGGNHGAAVAYAAQQLGYPATIFLPDATPAAKVERIRSYGATIVHGGADYATALEACLRFAAEGGAMNVHAYDDAAVLAGQGTLGLELEADAPGLTHVLVAVGGGGLVGGILGWYAGTSTRIVAVEPASCPTLHAAMAAGRPVAVAVGGVAVDSLGARLAGAETVRLALATGAESVLVSDAAIRAAQRWAWERLRLVLEPGGATALAPLLDGTWQAPAGARVGVVLCGGNTDPALCFT